MKRRIGVVAAACLIAAGTIGSAQQSGAPVQVRGTTIMPKVACAAMAGRTIAANRIGLPTGGAKITSATLKPGTGTGVLAANYVPEYCEINGSIAPVDPTAPPLNFQVNIPTRWNQGAWQFGVDGSDGHLAEMVVIVRNTNQAPLGYAYPPDLPFPIAHGYATYGGDGGHQNAPNPGGGGGGGPIPGQTSYANPPAEARPGGAGAGRFDNTQAARQAPAGSQPDGNAWMRNDESFINFAHAHVKKTHDAGVAVMQDMYGVRPRFTYFTGNSNGGKAALQALSRYGTDFDGILSTVPIPYYSARAISQERTRHIQRAPGAWLPPAKAAAIRNEIVRQCDSLDNLADGVISNYYDCRRLMDPSITPNPLAKIRCEGGADTGNNCLSDAQMATVNAFHAPTKIGFPMMNGETEYPGWPVGAEAVGGWMVSPVNPATLPLTAGANAMLMNRVPGWDPSKIGAPSETTPAVQALSKQVDAGEDWSAFLKGNNRKFVLYAGASDYQVNGMASGTFYEQAMKKNDRAALDRNTRFYMVPNAGHGSYGISATTGDTLPHFVDLVTLLADWVEKGVTPPDAVVMTLKESAPPYAVSVTKPICRYPNYPRYTGSGDAKKAESYRCAAPSGAAGATSAR